VTDNRSGVATDRRLQTLCGRARLSRHCSSSTSLSELAAAAVRCGVRARARHRCGPDRHLRVDAVPRPATGPAADARPL